MTSTHNIDIDDGGEALDELAGADPLECPACEAVGDACRFHAGWAAGWDACALFVAAHAGGPVVLEDGAAGELAVGLEQPDGAGVIVLGPGWFAGGGR